jgi:excisionase family DNA binding protein
LSVPPEPLDDRAPLAPADPTLDEAARILGVSRRLVYKLIERGELETYVLVHRRITAASIRRLREIAIAKGPQLQEPLNTGKRKIGRPRKRPEERPPAEHRR